MNRIREAFDTVYADEQMKRKAYRFIDEQYAGRKRRGTGMIAVFAALILCVIGIGAGMYLRTPVDLISVDSAMSVELSIDRTGRVTAARAFDDESQKVIERIDIVGKGTEGALALLMPAAMAEDNGVSVTFAAVSDASAARIVEQTRSAALSAGCHATATRTDRACFEEGHMHGMSGGKYRLSCELAALDDSVGMDDCARMNASGICERIAAHHDGKGQHSDDHDTAREETNDTEQTAIVPQFEATEMPEIKTAAAGVFEAPTATFACTPTCEPTARPTAKAKSSGSHKKDKGHHDRGHHH